MQNQWNPTEAEACNNDPLSLRVYTSRLLGSDPDLVLHGGGNTSVKATGTDFFGNSEEILYVKGSGWDLRTIEAEGFAPLRLGPVQAMAELDELSDSQMVKMLRAALINPDAPTPSVEAILHGIIPFQFVDHTHTDAVVTLTNNTRSEELLKEVYGDSVLVLPYVMPGFILAKQIHEVIAKTDIGKYDAIVLMHHGVFTYADDAKTAYSKMIEVVTKAEDYVNKTNNASQLAEGESNNDLLTLSKIRKAISKERGGAVIAKWDNSPQASGFANLPNIEEVTSKGCLTPEHIIRTKLKPLILKEDAETDVPEYACEYQGYFDRNGNENLTILDRAPRWAIIPGNGTASFGRTLKEANIIHDVTEHTKKAIQWGEALGSWQGLSEKELFDIEYWELEQVKLRSGKAEKELQGKVAIVTGAAAGIGRAIADGLHERGAAVVGLDLSPKIEEIFNAEDRIGEVCDVTNDERVAEIVNNTVKRFGGIDIVVSNAGIFTAGQMIEDLDPKNWERSMNINLTSHQRLLQKCIPFLKQGIDPTFIFIASRNVNAPGAGASSYSVAKAGTTQLARIAAMELAPFKVRVNVIHPDAVFDTELWTPEHLARSAERYGLTVEEYKTRNLMKAEITSKDVAGLVSTVAGKAFLKTTGAQIPIDGGNDRII